MATMPLYSTLLRCARCQAILSECPDREFEDWIVRCLACGVKNVLDCGTISEPFEWRVTVVGWRI